MHKFDLEAALAQSDVDYFLVTSSPPRSVKRGETYAYSVAVKSKRGGVTFNLDSGPKGMEISKTGEIKWQVPADSMEGNQDVILTLRDASGQDIFHTFTVRVVK